LIIWGNCRCPDVSERQRVERYRSTRRSAMRSSGSARHNGALAAPIRLGQRLAFACWLLACTSLNAEELPGYQLVAVDLNGDGKKGRNGKGVRTRKRGHH
jgi:hypothetical protein